MTKDRQQAGLDKAPQDPRPTTPFDVVGETGLLRLRYYAPAAARPGLAPVLIVYPMIKRPYILDLLPNRSVVRKRSSAAATPVSLFFPPGTWA